MMKTNDSMTRQVREAWVHDMTQDLPPLGAAGFPREQYMALAGVRHFDLVIVFLSMQIKYAMVF